MDTELDEGWISSEDERNLRAFQCACCRLVEHKLPAIARSAIQLGEDFNKGFVEPQILKEKARALWAHLDQQNKVLDVQGRNELDSAIRAALGCVFVGPIDIHDAHEHLDWGPFFCNRVENHRTEHMELRNTIFGADSSFTVSP